MNKIIVFALIVFLLIISTACNTNENKPIELLTIEDIINNIKSEGLSIKSIEIPKKLYSTHAKKQAGFEIDMSGDVIFIYEYTNGRTMDKDTVNIHNNLNGVKAKNNPLELSGNNICIIYLKNNKEEYEIEIKY